MTKGYNLLKGIVSHLQVMDDPKELRSDDIGLLAIIGLMIVGAFEAIGALIGALTAGSITLEGKSFQCYVGRKKVEGKLAHVSFKNGDYVEMLVKPIDNDQYLSYAVRMPQYHALYFPRSIGMTTLLLLKYLSIGIGILSLFIYVVLTIMMFIKTEVDISSWIIFTLTNILMFLIFLVLLFLLLGGCYTFISNRIFTTLGYPNPWSYNCSNENRRFRKLNRSGDPELFDDPQSREFQKVIKYDPNANYYCRTPTLPDWVTVIDERGLMPQLTEPQETPNQEQSND